MKWNFVICLFLLASVPTNSAPLASNVSTNGLFCKLCEETVTLAEFIFGSRIIRECLPEFVEFMCEELQIQDHMICKGIISDFKDEFLYVLGELLNEPANVCGLLDANCDEAGINPLKSNWSIPIPGNKPGHYQEYPPKKGKKPELKVLHLSDIHIDMSYAVGTEAKCDEPQCCRMPNKVGVANKVKTPAGYWGTVANCDIPIWTLESMLRHISKTHGQLDYIVISGDLESHAVWEYDKDEHQQAIRQIFSLFQQYFNTTRLFFSLGNHEGVPINNVAPHFVPNRFRMDWLYQTLDEAFGRNWLTDDERKSLTYNGCYVAKIAEGLRLISLNNVFGDNENFFLYLNQTDPDGTMTWLSNQLLAAEKAGDKVQIVAHIPGGDGEMFGAWAINYYRLVNRFEDTIVGQFFGHTHSELYYLTFEDPNDSKSRPTSVIYSAPSVTTYTDFNPAYRIYTIDGERPSSTYKVKDWEEWYLNLEAANKRNPGGIDAPWQLLYGSVKLEYGMRYIESGDWYQLAQRFLKFDRALQSYVSYRNRRFNTVCDYHCQQHTVCSIYTSQRDNRGLCKDLDVEKSAGWTKKQPWTREDLHNRLEAVREKKQKMLDLGFSQKPTKDGDKCPIMTKN